MKNFALILLLLFCLTSCKSSKRAISKKSTYSVSTTVDNKKAPLLTTDSVIKSVINYAKQFDGVKYKYGGTTNKGMDCSGLVTTAFKSEQILLPRTTEDLSVAGNWVDLKEVEKGDLLFFATKKNKRKINHVGLVIDTRPGYIQFIHATTSAGVIVSNLAERFWYLSFVQARRIL